MGLIQREIDRIRTALLSGSENRDELYAAQQALEWVLEPGGIRSPYALITGTAEGSADCLPADRQHPSSDSDAHTGSRQ
jgi:hypothetical protein